MAAMPINRLSRAALAALVLCLSVAAGARPAYAADSWSELKGAIFGDRAIADDRVVALEAPSRATDPAVVPVVIRLSEDAAIRQLTLIVDENPAPVAATFTLGPDTGIRSIETRLRINAYSNVRAVAETADGSLHESVVYVKASGGCAAPAARNPAEAASTLGEMRLRRLLEAANGQTQEAQLMIRHPNNSGLQRDQVTHLYIPAHFVSDLEIRLDDKPFLSMSGGISISEDPNFRFRYDGPDGVFKVIASDTEGQTFARAFSPGEG
ncbi:quinoprotein dehydrogenase-associated SoxYZ-like carrier [Aureimonas sp. OT7]|uniref:quinoprotein dehydrogenase-associated SoxYZ-like carrier n=1 Tax=Aureimonas TaxID=414371 RepID=UPI00178400EE|nr:MULTISPECIES: quinoprotein dehydrogenase-associated SoxYZ-like carrier [Aureimonas]QOG07702.1 quinoprotein dehydrogenase-associated SoxYZ-like carrier [Aureimonas sp. OT7]